MAGWLADRGARWIVLNGRREPDEAAEAAIEALGKRGVKVSVELADVANSEAVDGMLERIRTELPPLAGVIHSAGALADAALGNQSWDRFERVLGPKMLGAWHLHRATQDLDLGLFVLFSAATGVLGNAGQANHGAANAFLDQLARHRRSLGLAGQSIAWGAWSGVGAAEGRRSGIVGRMEAAGVGWITPRQGIRALDSLVRQDVPTSLVAPVDWEVLADRESEPPPLLEEVLAGSGKRPVGKLTAPGGLVEGLRQVPAQEQEGLVVEFLLGELQSILRLASPPEPTAGFFDLGMDSLMAVELRNRINRALAGDHVVSNTAVFDYPDATSLGRHLAERLAGILEESREGPQAAVEPRPVTDATGAVAIVGMACRFPGGADLAAFWRLLQDGKDAVGEGRQGRVTTPGRAGYVEGIDRFDAEFFRIAPVEARLMDPQQRLMLETSWEALEDAGIDPGGLRGVRAGVYAGISSSDYRDLVTGGNAGGAAGLHAATGTSGAVAVGRVAFTLGLEGPVMAVDTVCSSSLVAVHQASAALQRGEADLVLAGGVNAILSPDATEAFAKAGMLSPDGKCKTFDAAADGYVRGEGCGMVVLKRLADAMADGHRIWGVIRGSAVNHDGASAGLTVPNGPAQERVIEEALERAAVEPAEVDYLEAHGTGTELGDPIEVHAAAAVYGRGRAAGRPLLLGSVKTNIGHLEAAAGVAGLIKAVLSMSRGVVPRSLHFREPNPRIDWDGLPVQVASEAAAWPDSADRPARSGVSSFGVSGTNAHVVVESVPSAGEWAGDRDWLQAAAVPVGASMQTAGTRLERRRERVLALSGQTAVAVRDLARRYLAWLADRAAPAAEAVEAPEGPAGGLLAEMAWTAGVGRHHFEWRSGLAFRDAAELQQKLKALAGGGTVAQSAAGPKVAFVYTGQGSQWAGMGRDLYESEPVVRGVLDRCEAAMRELRGESLLDVMFGAEGAVGSLQDTRWAQPALYALGCALEELWRSAGVRPAAVLGHSAGELAAARAAGVWDLEKGLRFAAVRGELMGRMAADGAGAMLAVFARAARVEAVLGEWNSARSGPGLALAADNGTHVVVSGPSDGVEALAKRFAAERVRIVQLETRQAFHSALMDPVLDGLEAALEAADPGGASTAILVSGVTGRSVRTDEVADGAYWRRQAREPVQFARGVEELAGLGAEIVLELGPQPVLGPLVRACWPAGKGAGNSPVPVVLASLVRSADDGDGFAHAVAASYEAGADLDFDGLFAGEVRRRTGLPTYPFQRRRHWVDRGRRIAKGDHSLLGPRRDLPGGEVTFETELFATEPEWLEGYRILGLAAAPAGLHGALVLAAGADVLAGQGGTGVLVEDFRLREPLVLPRGKEGHGGRAVQVMINRAEASGPRGVRVFSRGADEESWTLHAEGRVSEGIGEPDSGTDLEAVKERLEAISAAAFYRDLDASDVTCGSSFRTVESLWTGPGEAIGEVILANEESETGLDHHPRQLEGCFQVVGAAAAGRSSECSYSVLECDRLWVRSALPERVVCHARVADLAAHGDAARQLVAADLWLYDAAGAEIGGASGLAVRRVAPTALVAAKAVGKLLYEVAWRERPHEGGIRPATFLAGPRDVFEATGELEGYLAAEATDLGSLRALQEDLEALARGYALAGLEQLGWQREKGARADPGKLRRHLKVVADQERLFGRLFGMLAEAGALEEAPGEGWTVVAGAADPLPVGIVDDPDGFAEEAGRRHPQGRIELQLLARCGAALPDVLRGRADPVALLFSGEGTGAADFYGRVPALRAANRMTGDVVASLASDLPEGRRLRVLEVGAGTASSTAALLEALPSGRFDYAFTDVSAGFFAAAEERFGKDHPSVEYRVLDIESDPTAQGFEMHRYDLVVAANVLHATRDLSESLGHCRKLLAPSGELVLLEGLRRRGWLDLTFGLLEGWWRFADPYRKDYALLEEAAWRAALADAGFGEVAVWGGSRDEEVKEHGLIVARAPAEVVEPAGTWVLAAPHGGREEVPELAAALAGKNQTVVVASDDGAVQDAAVGPGIITTRVDLERREAWRALLDGLPCRAPLRGVVHLSGLGGPGGPVRGAGLAQDTRRANASALALAQGLLDSSAQPANGLWFLTRGAQVVEREPGAHLAAAALWGLGRTLALEAPQLRSRLVDLDPGGARPAGCLRGRVSVSGPGDASSAPKRTAICSAPGAAQPWRGDGPQPPGQRNVLGDRGTWGDRSSSGGLARGPRRSQHRAERAATAGCRNGGGDREVTRGRSGGARGTRRRGRCRSCCRHGGTACVGDSTVGGGSALRRGRGGCGTAKPDLGAVRGGACGEDARGMESTPGNRGTGPGSVPAVFECGGSPRKPRTGEPRGGQRIPGSARAPSTGDRAVGPIHRVGTVVGPGRGGGSACRDRRSAGVGWHRLDRAPAGLAGAWSAYPTGDNDELGGTDGLVGARDPRCLAADSGGATAADDRRGRPDCRILASPCGPAAADAVGRAPSPLGDAPATGTADSPAA